MACQPRASRGQEPCLCFDSKNLVLCMSTGVSTCAADWLTFGVGETVSKPCSPVLGLAGWGFLSAIHSSQAVTLAVAIHFRVLRYLYSLSNWSHSQKVIRKAFLLRSHGAFSFLACLVFFLDISLSLQIFCLGTVNWTLTDRGSFLERSMVVMICMWFQVSESCSETAQGGELEDLEF